MTIFDVRHQPTAQLLLQRAMCSARVPHAYIFCGPEGVGKGMLAARFARLLLCGERRACSDPPPEYAKLQVDRQDTRTGWQDSCGVCRSCKLVDAGTHPDCHFVHRRLIKFHPDAAVRNRKALELGVDVIRQFVIAAAQKKPALGSQKVFVLQECEKLNIAGQNALLKTLEEPPPGTHLILLTTSVEKLLPTTRSRCQAARFRPLPTSFVTEQLRTLLPDAPAEELHYFARQDPGSIGVAWQLLQDGFYSCNQALVQSLVQLKRTDSLRLASEIEELGKQMKPVVLERARKEIVRAEHAGRRSANTPDSQESMSGPAAEMSDTEANRQALRRLFSMVATLYRDVLNLSSGNAPGICNLQAKDGIGRLADRLGARRSRSAIAAVVEAESQLNLNANTRLCLEGLTIQLARLHDV